MPKCGGGGTGRAHFSLGRPPGPPVDPPLAITHNALGGLIILFIYNLLAYGILYDCQQESRAVASKPHDAAAVLFGLMFAATTFTPSLRVAKFRKPGFRAPNIAAQNKI